MKISIKEKTCTAAGDFGRFAPQIVMGLEGRKAWITNTKLTFETSQHNISLFLSVFPEAQLSDDRQDLSPFDKEEESAADPKPEFVFEPFDFQEDIFRRFKNKEVWALFSEQGTGKTKTAIDIICHRYKKGTVTGTIILSNPKGVHSQWIKEQFPRHMWPSVKWNGYVWDGKKPPPWLTKSELELQVISGNIDMVKSKRGLELLTTFARRHGNKLIIIIDESDAIKNLNSQRSKLLRKELSHFTAQRAIMTGTPIAKDLTDEWAQFYFLDPSIIGHKYLTSFRAQYCIMGGYEGRAVVGHKNLEKFKVVTQPHIFRATKDQLGLPPKVYDKIVFDLTDRQKRMIKDIRDQFFHDYNEDKKNGRVSVVNGASAIIKVQQISNGFVFTETGETIHLDNPRMEALRHLLYQTSGPRLIWCRFREDVHLIRDELKGRCVTIYGENDGKERDEAKRKFLSGEAEYMIATPAAAGRGLDGLQKVCSTAIYYSNSYNVIDRWQSEDRIHRSGMVGTATYFDLIARGSIDRAILRNHDTKKTITNAILLEEGELE